MPLLIDRTVASFVDETASSSPAPGGGSISALAATLAASLTAMVARLTIGKKKYADVELEFKGILERSDRLRTELLALIDADTEAFNGVMAAFGLAKETEEQKNTRSAAIENATKKATQVPLELLRRTAEVVPLIEAAARRGNVNSRSDAGVAALQLAAAAQGAALNVYINLAGLKDEGFRGEARSEADRLEKDVAGHCAGIAAFVRSALVA